MIQAIRMLQANHCILCLFFFMSLIINLVNEVRSFPKSPTLDETFHIAYLRIACWVEQQASRRVLSMKQDARKQEFDAAQNQSIYWSGLL